MFADITWGKLVYDVSMALIVGVIAGLIVEGGIRAREAARAKPVVKILRSELLRFTDDFLQRTLPGQLWKISPRYYLFAPGLEVYVTLEVPSTIDESELFEAGRLNLPNIALEREVIKAKAGQADLSSEQVKDMTEKLRPFPADQIEELKITRGKLEGIYQRYGSYLSDEISELLAKLYISLSQAILYADETRLFRDEKDDEKNDERIQSVYTQEMVSAWSTAYGILGAASRGTRSEDTEAKMARSMKRVQDIVDRVEKKTGIKLDSRSGQGPKT